MLEQVLLVSLSPTQHLSQLVIIHSETVGRVRIVQDAVIPLRIAYICFGIVLNWFATVNSLLIQ